MNILKTLCDLIMQCIYHYDNQKNFFEIVGSELYQEITKSMANCNNELQTRESIRGANYNCGYRTKRRRSESRAPLRSPSPASL